VMMFLSAHRNDCINHIVHDLLDLLTIWTKVFVNDEPDEESGNEAEGCENVEHDIISVISMYSVNTRATALHERGRVSPALWCHALRMRCANPVQRASAEQFWIAAFTASSLPTSTTICFARVMAVYNKLRWRPNCIEVVTGITTTGY